MSVARGCGIISSVASVLSFLALPSIHLFLFPNQPLPYLSSPGRPCMAEMTAVMTCWKAYSFDDIPCKKEVEEFVKCSERVVS